MKHVVIDLEMNRVANVFKEERAVATQEVIEIGAVLLDEAYNEIGSFKTFVKPMFNDKIEAYYTRITGITTEMVKHAPEFPEAIKMFTSWCRSINDEVQIYQWSTSDIDQITKEVQQKHMDISKEDEPYLTNWYDFQAEFGEVLGLDRQLSLKDAIMYADINMQGRFHDALDDARNTAELLSVIRTPAKCKKALEHVIEALTPKSISTTLGEMFNFDALLAS